MSAATAPARLFEPRRRDSARPAPARRPGGAPPPGFPQRRPAVGGGVTLAERLDRAWETVLATGAAECPVCGDRLERANGEGRCGGCGSSLG